MSSQAVAASRGNALFVTCFAALVATAFCFVLRTFVIDDWGHEFGLSATQKGEHDVQHGTQLHATFFTQEKTGVFGSYHALEGKVAAADAETRAVVESVVTGSKKTALKSVALLPLVMLTAYLLLIVYFRSRGGYRAVALTSG
jgi:hypothetical protein